MDSVVTPRRRSGDSAIALVVALLAWFVAGYVFFLHVTTDPAAQRVRIRWSSTVEESQRLTLEANTGLVSPEREAENTWTYGLSDNSRASIERLLSLPQVADTAHIDRPNLQLELDRPDLPEWVRALAQQRRLLGAAAGLAIIALVATWRARDLIRRAMRGLATFVVLAWRRLRYWWLRIQQLTRRTFLVGVATATLAVLVLTANGQLFDATFYATTGATALRLGDRPFRDFVDTGIPLAEVTTAAAQWLSGDRILGEFIRQWLFIIAGMVLAADLGLRLSRSMRATAVAMALALLILAATPIYHYSKLFFFPLSIWTCWRYIDAPSPQRGAIVAIVTALAFLYRHDYGIYLGLASVAAFVLARIPTPAARSSRSLLLDSASYAATLMVVLVPWLVMAQMGEGLTDYARSRAQLFQGTSGSAYAALRHINPIRAFSPAPLPPPQTGIVSFTWDLDVDDAMRLALEREHRLNFVGLDEAGRFRYRIGNVFEPELLALAPYIDNPSGFVWTRLLEYRSGLPSQEGMILWVQQMMLLIPIALIIVGGVELLPWRTDAARKAEAARLLLAGVAIGVIDAALLRQPSYVVTVTPISMALAGRFLVSGNRLGRYVVTGLAILTTVAVVLWARQSELFSPPAELARSVSAAFVQLIARPDSSSRPYRYLRECTSPGDRILVTGVTPLDVSYFARRPIAGGQTNWHVGWRSDPVHEAQALALLERQSVPLAFSTSEPVLEDFARYPRIHAYLATNYTAVRGTNGRILVDGRRRPTGAFEPGGYPCFR